MINAIFGDEIHYVLITRQKFKKFGRGLEIHLADAKFTRIRSPYFEGLRYVLQFKDFDTAFLVHRALANRQIWKERSRVRRALVESQDYYHTKEDLRKIWHIQNGCCYYTGISLGDDFDSGIFSVDHINPLCLGGNDGPLNIALTTTHINRLKGPKTKKFFLKKIKVGKEVTGKMRAIDRARKALFILVDRKKNGK